MSANLPLMSPIIQLVRRKYRTVREHVPEDEESSNILELSTMELRNKDMRAKKAASARMQGSSVATNMEGMDSKRRDHSGFGMPDSRTIVEMDWEQQGTEMHAGVCSLDGVEPMRYGQRGFR